MSDKPVPIVCKWRIADPDLGDTYDTDCGNRYEFSSDPPHVWMTFCCYCGRLVRFETAGRGEGMTQELSERISRGMALLDADRPGWADEIGYVVRRGRPVRMENFRCCLLGHLFGSYDQGKIVLKLQTFQDAKAAGFSEGEADELGDCRLQADVPKATWDVLRAGWFEAIGNRLAYAALRGPRP